MYRQRDFYKYARYIHAWLSAFAFVLLMFFAATGLLLNNPSWFSRDIPEQHHQFKLSKAQAQQIAASQNPSAVVLQLLQAQHTVVGRLQSSEVIDGDVMLRLESPAGQSDVVYSPTTLQIEINQKPASTVSLLSELHRGKNTSVAWSWLIDISAIIILLLSIAGFILFLSLKGRLLSHVLLMLMSVLLLMALIYGAV